MPNRPRPRRVAVSGARMRFANTLADLMNVSRTGALIRLDYRLRTGGEWPLVLELPTDRAVWLSGRVVRCERAENAPAGLLENRYMLGLTFVEPSAEALAILDKVCGPPAASVLPSVASPLRRRLIASRVRLRRMSVSLRRSCPECGAIDISKEGTHHYSCEQCGQRFVGIRLGPLRLSL